MAPSSETTHKIFAVIAPYFAQAQGIEGRAARIATARRWATRVAWAGVGAIFIASVARTLWPALPVGLWVGVSVLAVAFGGLIAIVRPRPTRVTLRDVAQRLDRGVDRHNAIATALELAQGNNLSTFEARAVDAGLAALSRHATAGVTDLFTATGGKGRLVPVVGRFAVGLVAAVLAMLTGAVRPVVWSPASVADASSVHVFPDQNNVRPPQSQATERADSGHRPPSDSRANLGPNRLILSESRQPAKGGVGSGASASGDTPGVVGTSSAGAGVAAGRAKASPSQSRSDTARSGQSDSAPAGDTILASDAAADPMAAASGSNGAAGASADNAAAAAGGADGASRPPAASAAGPTGGEGGRSPSAAPDASSVGGGSASEAAADVSTGSGPPGGGQDQKKKSRGVPPVFLGTTEADLLQGPVLPGRDRRSIRAVRPRPDPAPLPAAGSSRPRAGDEPEVDVFHVPGASVDTVSQYFSRLHAEPKP